MSWQDNLGANFIAIGLAGQVHNDCLRWGIHANLDVGVVSGCPLEVLRELYVDWDPYLTTLKARWYDDDCFR